MGILASLSPDEIRARGSIKDSDVLRLRRAYYDDGTITAEEAEALFALNDDCPIKDPSWAEFFVEALADYLVDQIEPEGYVVAANAQWLIDRIGRNGHVDSNTELELLVAVLDKARWSPPSLAKFAIEQIKHAVTTGAGPLRAGQPVEPGTITAGEVALLRRILFAFGGIGGVAVTRAEADALIEINRSLTAGRRYPEWSDLFAKAVGNAVLSGLGHVVPSREEALRQDNWLEAPDSRNSLALLMDGLGHDADAISARQRIGGFLGRMVEGGVGAVWASMRAQSPEERALARLEIQRLEIVTNEAIDEVEEAWLLERFGHDRRLDDNETALLAFITREASALPPAVKELASKAQNQAVCVA